MSRKRLYAVVLILIAASLSLRLLVPSVPPAQAAGGSYGLVWTAADPDLNKGKYLPTYTKVPPSAISCPAGGRAADPMVDAVYAHPTTGERDSVTSLAPYSLALGMIVPFEVLVTVSGSTDPESGMIQFTGGWETVTTSGGDFGYDETYKVYCAFVDYGDSKTIETGTQTNGQATVYNWTSTMVGTEIQGTIYLSGLDDGDSVVVEIWVVLQDYWPAGGATGNVQSRLVSAKTGPSTTYPNGQTINTGNQTVVLKQVGEFESNDVDLALLKDDDDVWKAIGEEYNYTLTISYPATTGTGAVANTVTVVDTLDEWLDFVQVVSITDPDNLGRSCTYSSSTHQLTCALKYMHQLEQVQVVFRVKAVPGVPLSSLCEDPNDNISCGTCPASGTAAAGEPDVCNSACVSTISDDTVSANNCDDEPKDIKYPTAVTLVSFTATGLPGAIQLDWETSSEVDNAGFNLYRGPSLNAHRTKLNYELIPSLQPPGSLEGAVYLHIDTTMPGMTTYYYWLEDVDILGYTELHGPVSARVEK